MPKITDKPNDPDYHKNYYQSHKEGWNTKPKKKVDYCRRIYGVQLSIEEVETLGENYKEVARFLRDAEKIKNLYGDFLRGRESVLL